MLSRLKQWLHPRHPLRLLYHKLKAIVAAIWYRFPADQLKVIAVTGTNGKTTTCHLITDILREAGHKVGMITTSDFRIGDSVMMNDYKMTTLSPFVTQRMIRDMVEQGCDHLVLEATSHAMDQNRLWGVNVDVAVFTNITHDHLDYHGTVEEYVEAKGQLFKRMNRSRQKDGQPKIAVVNDADEYSAYFKEIGSDRLYTFGSKESAFRAEDLDLKPSGTGFTFKIPNDQIRIQFPLPARFNVDNALAAATVAVALQINLKVIQTALEKANPVPGRIEPIMEGQKYTAIVDYAHAPDALEKLLSMFKELTPKRLILVFGATGDRDKTKRPTMGEIAHKHADLIVLTDDDPYTENPLSIIEQVAKGIDRKEGDRFWKVLDRREAIRLALAVAREGDTVLVTGKGCEPVQVIGDQHIPSDDRQIIRDFLSREIEVEIGDGEVQRGNRYLEG